MHSSTTQPRRRPLLTLGAFLLAIVAVTGLFASSNPAVAAEAGDTIGVATRPAGADGRPDSRTTFSYKADPGQSVTDRVLIGNTGSKRQDFTVYATDAFNGADGAFSLLATAETPTGIGTWVRFDNGEDRVQFSLEPDEVRLLTFTVQFPADATPGDHVGGLVASVIEEGQQVSLDRRVATSLYARVSGELQPQLTIASFEAEHQGDWWNPFGGSVKIRYTVNNPGNVALAANLTASVNTWFWIPATGEQGGTNPVLLPGNSATYEFSVAGVGQWGYLNPALKLSPFVDSQDEDLQVLMTPITRDAIVFALPWTLLIVLVIAAAIVFLLRWRRRRDEARAQEWVDYIEQNAESGAVASRGEANGGDELTGAGKATAP